MAELKLKNFLKGAKVPLIAVLIYALVTLFSVFHHEIWADEAQVWMLTKYISFPSLFKHLVNEGHPSFFYLLTMPFAKLSDNIIWMQLICWFSSVLAVFFLWKETKFSYITKIIITMSAPFIYYFPVIARSYSIIPLLVILLAIFHDKTNTHPYFYAFLLIALTHTHIIVSMFTFLLFIRFLYLNIYKPYKNKEKIEKKFIIASSLMFFGFLALFVQLIGTTSSNVYINYKPKENKIMAFVRVVLVFIFSSVDSFYLRTHLNYFTPFTISFGFLFCVSFLVSALALYKNNKKLFSIFLISSIFQIAVYVLCYSELIRATRVFVLYLMLLFSYVVLFNRGKFINKGFFKKKNVEIILCVFFAFMFFNGYKSVLLDNLYDYSGSYKLAKFIKTNYLNKNQKPIILTDVQNETIAINYYLDPYNLYEVSSGKQFKYVVWSIDTVGIFDEDIWSDYCRQIRKKDKNSTILVVDTYSPTALYYNKYKPWKDFDLVYVTGNTLEYFENFKLYKYKY